MSPAAISISTCASSSGARCRSVFGGRSFEAPARALEGVSDGGGRSGHVSLGQTHQRETRLGIPPGAMGGQQGFLRARDVSLVKADPSELVQRPPELAAQVRTQFLAGHERLNLRLVAHPRSLRISAR